MGTKRNSNNSVIFKLNADIPETMIVRLVGAKIGDAFSGLPFDPDLRILSAKSRKRPKGSIALKLKGKPISPESLLLVVAKLS